MLAWLVREYFVLATVVEAPLRGDVREYVAYAWNLLDHGTFSRIWPGDGTPVPDAYRGPGYPLFLMLCMAVGGQPDGWYWLALHLQAVLGALTVTMTVLLARHWIPAGWAFFAGVLAALWPHHIAATGALLSEVVFGFALMLALLLTAETIRRGRIGWAAAAGAAYVYAALVSMVSLLFPLFAAWVLWRSAARKPALALLIVALLGAGLWSLRNATIPATPATPGRAAINLVQGSWPLYHRAYVFSRNDHQAAREIMGAIDRETRLLASDPAAGFASIRQRLASDPAWYARWYLLQKPFLLWDWDIRIGMGDVYFHRQSGSPLETHPLLNATKRLFKVLNPAIFALSALACVVLLLGWMRDKHRLPPAAVVVAGFCVYVTAVHVVFQAEPRYSIPYRPMQLLMLASGCWLLTEALRKRMGI